MSRKRESRLRNALSVRRRLVFDDEPSENGVTLSAGKCIPANFESSQQGAHLSGNLLGYLPGLSVDENEVLQELLWNNPEPKSASCQTDNEYNKNGCLNSSQYTVLRPPQFHYDHQDHGSRDIIAVVFYIVFLLCIFFILLSFIPWSPTILQDLQLSHDEESPKLLYQNQHFICLFGLLTTVCIAALIAVSCCGFSWIIIYFDSLKPGEIPPTPMSPSKYKVQSGHTFHLSYIIATVNGIVVFLYYLWLSSDNYML